MNILEKIIAKKIQEVEKREKLHPLGSFFSDLVPPHRDFAQALKKPRFSRIPSLICEIKKASPSEGVIRKKFNHVDIAHIYNRYANAMSILTDEIFFQGNLKYITDIDKFTKIPLLQKDFIIDPYQVYEARYLGADAILLIVAALDRMQLHALYQLAKDLGMAVLVEVHNEEELEEALTLKPTIIGINNRNLQTFVTDLDTTHRLARLVPANITLVSESGIKTHEDLVSVKQVANAALIGTTLMQQENIREGLEHLVKVGG